MVHVSSRIILITKQSCLLLLSLCAASIYASPRWFLVREYSILLVIRSTFYITPLIVVARCAEMH